MLRENYRRLLDDPRTWWATLATLAFVGVALWLAATTSVNVPSAAVLAARGPVAVAVHDGSLALPDLFRVTDGALGSAFVDQVRTALVSRFTRWNIHLETALAFVYRVAVFAGICALLARQNALLAAAVPVSALIFAPHTLDEPLFGLLLLALWLLADFAPDYRRLAAAGGLAFLALVSGAELAVLAMTPLFFGYRKWHHTVTWLWLLVVLLIVYVNRPGIVFAPQFTSIADLIGGGPGIVSAWLAGLGAPLAINPSVAAGAGALALLSLAASTIALVRAGRGRESGVWLGYAAAALTPGVSLPLWVAVAALGALVIDVKPLARAHALLTVLAVPFFAIAAVTHAPDTPNADCFFAYPLSRDAACLDATDPALVDALAVHRLALFGARQYDTPLPEIYAEDAPVFVQTRSRAYNNSLAWLLLGDLPLKDRALLLPSDPVPANMAERAYEVHPQFWTLTSAGLDAPLRTDGYARVYEAFFPYAGVEMELAGWMPAPDALDAPVEAGPNMRLLAWAVPGGAQITACDTLTLHTVWEAAAPLDQPWRVSFVALGTSGQPLTINEDPLPLPVMAWRPGVRYLVVRDLLGPCEPGDYPMRLSLIYQTQTESGAYVTDRLPIDGADAYDLGVLSVAGR